MSSWDQMPAASSPTTVSGGWGSSEVKQDSSSGWGSSAPAQSSSSSGWGSSAPAQPSSSSSGWGSSAPAQSSSSGSGWGSSAPAQSSSSSSGWGSSAPAQSSSSSSGWGSSAPAQSSSSSSGWGSSAPAQSSSSGSGWGSSAPAQSSSSSSGWGSSAPAQSSSSSSGWGSSAPAQSSSSGSGWGSSAPAQSSSSSSGWGSSAPAQSSSSSSGWGSSAPAQSSSDSGWGGAGSSAPAPEWGGSSGGSFDQGSPDADVKQDSSSGWGSSAPAQSSSSSGWGSSAPAQPSSSSSGWGSSAPAQSSSSSSGWGSSAPAQSSSSSSGWGSSAPAQSSSSSSGWGSSAPAQSSSSGSGWGSSAPAQSSSSSSGWGSSAPAQSSSSSSGWGSSAPAQSSSDSGWGGAGSSAPAPEWGGSSGGSFDQGSPDADGKRRFADGENNIELEQVDWHTEDVPTFKKGFYVEHPVVARRSDAEVDEWRQSHRITCTPGVPKPCLTFDEMNLPPFLLDRIKDHGFTAPRPIQSQAIPTVLMCEDVVGIADTGSGKTLAFIAPAIVHLQAQPPRGDRDGPSVLILAPTRELAIQIFEETNKFLAGGPYVAGVAYGGKGNRREQADIIRSGVDIAIGTPGRLMDFVQNRVLKLRRVTYFVLDEADKMLDMGFKRDIVMIQHIAIGTPGRLMDFVQNRVLKLRRVTYFVLDEADKMLDMGFKRDIVMIQRRIHEQKQTLMWSATWPKVVVDLARQFLPRGYQQINLGSLKQHACKDVLQKFVFCRRDDKFSHFVKFLREQGAKKYLVFEERKLDCDTLADDLEREGFPSSAIHGDKDQFTRESALRNFKGSTGGLLIATDVASRGIDVPDIDWVVNFSMPRDITTYIHRIGRTGRAGKKGESLTFFTDKDANLTFELVEVLTDAGQPVPNELSELSSRLGGGY
ncbi:Probable ATP-dependent RNA helicase ddx17 [Aduncisulcus paluster]|uniref:RNA helicase n=1 Tax=Aduncisulcus paluster TaxID=2918883 RepID=A0ABQ5KX66_9EUKA|nr:Probable ATP-dependent RNA helicase ddx17 [Aduncisulcus paluster]